ncbi:MAG: YkgJ family cysteine cluster protein [Candidatus Bathyarchaeota archaeon]
MDMKPLPWRSVSSWMCLRCGECCGLIVQLTVREWLEITRSYGNSIVFQGIDGFFLRRTVDERCPFILSGSDGWLCGLQYSKPLTCKIWPFRILTEPIYGEGNEAFFDYRNRRFYIYAIPHCPGITWGHPTERLIKRVLPEFIDVRFGFKGTRHFSTSRLPFPP